MDFPSRTNGHHVVKTVTVKVVKVEINDAGWVRVVKLREEASSGAVGEVNAELVIGRSVADDVVVIVTIDVGQMHPGGVRTGNLPWRHRDARDIGVRDDSESRCCGVGWRGCVPAGNGCGAREQGKINLGIVVDIAFGNIVNIPCLEEPSRKRWRKTDF